MPEATCISLNLPANMLDFKYDIVNFIIPEIVPEGMYNFNTVFMNERFEFGPMGTWNFCISN